MTHDPTNRSTGLLTLAGLSASLLILAAQGCRAERSSNRYSYAERSTGVMEVRFLPGAVMKTIEFTVYGDGRVRCQVVATGPGRQVLDQFERRLDSQQVAGLVEDAVVTGLVDFDADAFRRRLGERGETAPYVVDGGAVYFKIELDYFARGTEPPEAPFSHSLLLDSPDEYARRFPQEKQFGSLQRITRLLSDLYWEHKRH